MGILHPFKGLKKTCTFCTLINCLKDVAQSLKHFLKISFSSHTSLTVPSAVTMSLIQDGSALVETGIGISKTLCTFLRFINGHLTFLLIVFFGSFKKSFHHLYCSNDKKHFFFSIAVLIASNLHSSYCGETYFGTPEIQ